MFDLLKDLYERQLSKYTLSIKTTINKSNTTLENSLKQKVEILTSHSNNINYLLVNFILDWLSFEDFFIFACLKSKII